METFQQSRNLKTNWRLFFLKLTSLNKGSIFSFHAGSGGLVSIATWELESHKIHTSIGKPNRLNPLLRGLNLIW